MDDVGVLAILIAAAFAVGFVAGYTVRAAISGKRRRRAQRRLRAIARPFILPEPEPELSDGKLHGGSSEVRAFGPAPVDTDPLSERTVRAASNIAGTATSNETRGNFAEDFEVPAPAPHESGPDSPARKVQLH